MKRAFFIAFLGLTVIALTFVNACFAEELAPLRDYSGIEIPKGTFIPAIITQAVSTEYSDEGTKVKFIATNSLYLYETNIIPKETEFFGYVEKINEPVQGTNASMVIKVTKLKLPDGFEIPIKGYVYTSNNNLIGGELTPPAQFDRMQSFRQGFYSYSYLVPGATRKMGEHTVVKAGSDIMLILTAPTYITHTVIN